MKRIIAVLAAALALVLTLAGCGSSGSSSKSSTPSAPPTSSGASGTTTYPSAPGSIIVGSADFPESEVLADVYGDAMSAKGVSVTKKLNIGERPAYIAALKDGSINFIPEYTGSILAYFDTTRHAEDARRTSTPRCRQGAERTDGAEVRTGAGQRLDHGDKGHRRRSTT